MLFTFSLFGQTDQRIMFYGEIGFGLSNPGVSRVSADYNTNTALTIGKKLLCFRASIIDNGAFGFGYPSKELISKNALLGRYISVYHEYDSNNQSTLEWNVLLFAGYSSVKSIMRTAYTINNQSYVESVEKVGYGFPIEIDFQYLLPRYRGATLKLFYNFNNIQRFYGASLVITFGFV